MTRRMKDLECSPAITQVGKDYEESKSLEQSIQVAANRLECT